MAKIYWGNELKCCRWIYSYRVFLIGLAGVTRGPWHHHSIFQPIENPPGHTSSARWKVAPGKTPPMHSPWSCLASHVGQLYHVNVFATLRRCFQHYRRCVDFSVSRRGGCREVQIFRFFNRSQQNNPTYNKSFHCVILGTGLYLYRNRGPVNGK